MTYGSQSGALIPVDVIIDLASKAFDRIYKARARHKDSIIQGIMDEDRNSFWSNMKRNLPFARTTPMTREEAEEEYKVRDKNTYGVYKQLFNRIHVDSYNRLVTLIESAKATKEIGVNQMFITSEDLACMKNEYR